MYDEIIISACIYDKNFFPFRNIWNIDHFDCLLQINYAQKMQYNCGVFLTLC